MQKRAGLESARKLVGYVIIALALRLVGSRMGAEQSEGCAGTLSQGTGRGEALRSLPAGSIAAFVRSGETSSMGPSTRTGRGDPPYPNYKRLRGEGSLWAAWSCVKEAGRAASPETQREIKRFEHFERKNIRRIGVQLRKETFSFGQARGAPIKRPGKGPRPVVVSAIDARIVQRAVLDELQRLPETKPYFESRHSFGGIIRKSRAHAIAAAREALNSGAAYFVRSDIRDFFTRIPRRVVVEILSAGLDPRAAHLLDEATYLELENTKELGNLRDLFPTEELGVAQGLCLSPLMGNVLLHEFDAQMNGRGIRFLRYIDDFLILGENESKVMKAFESALKALERLGMSAYDPREDSGKADRGSTTRAFDFLGCSIQRGLVQPSRASRDRILDRVRRMLHDAESSWHAPAAVHEKHASLARVLYDLGNVLRGWRDSYSFCENAFVFLQLDEQIDAELDRFQRRFGERLLRAAKAEQRLLLGLPILAA